jgi:hypothetical protein
VDATAQGGAADQQPAAEPGGVGARSLADTTRFAGAKVQLRNCVAFRSAATTGFPSGPVTFTWPALASTSIAASIASRGQP